MKSIKNFCLAVILLACSSLIKSNIYAQTIDRHDNYLMKYRTSTTPTYTILYENENKLYFKPSASDATPTLAAKFTIDASNIDMPALKLVGTPPSNNVPALRISGYGFGIESSGSIRIDGSGNLAAALFTKGNIYCDGTLVVDRMDVESNSIVSIGTIKAPKVNTNLLFFGDRSAPGIFYTCSSGFDFYIRDPMLNCESGQNINPNGINTDRTLRVTHGKLEVLGNLQTHGFQLTDGFEAQGKVLISDRNGFGNWTAVSDVVKGDNLGNHIVTENLKMNDYSILNGSLGDRPLMREDGSLYNPGLRFNANNNMVLETGQTATMAVVSSSNAPSSIWVSNWSSGGFGLVKNPDKFTGGIYWDEHQPTAVISFNTQKVGIGVMPPAEGEYGLYVAQGILTEEVKVELKGGPDWPDYVFASNYILNSLSDVETYISKNKHLPDLPSAESVKKDGINLGEMNALLLKKIEELTLYMIAQDKKIQALEAKMNVK